MKKLLALLLALFLCMSLAPAEESEGETENTEDEDWGYGYINPNLDYYLGLPKDWIIIGSGTTGNQKILDNNELLSVNSSFDPYYLSRQITKDNDILICLTPDGKQGMTLVYGASEFMDNSTLIDHEDDFRAQIKKDNPSVQFNDAECGSYSFNSLESVLRLSMNYGGGSINQFCVVSGRYMFVFTFYNVKESSEDSSEITAKNMLSLFKTGVSEFKDSGKN